MWIKNKDDLKRFEETIGRCSKSVWIVTPAGEQFNLKDPKEMYKGLYCMMNANEYEEPEVFANCAEDEMLLFDYIETGRAA